MAPGVQPDPARGCGDGAGAELSPLPPLCSRNEEGTVLACGAVRVLFVPARWGWAVFVGVLASPKPVVCPFISLKGSCMVCIGNLQIWFFHSSQLLNTHHLSFLADLFPPS